MPTPKEVFENPEKFLPYLQSSNLEGQFFERKEVRDDSKTQRDNIREKIIQTISGFANSNRDGGLLVLGMADDGTIIGWNHVREENLNGILQAKEGGLRGHSTITEEFHCKNIQGDDDRIYLLYTPWTSNAICETTHSFPKAWKRDGPRCISLTEQDREQLILHAAENCVFSSVEWKVRLETARISIALTIRSFDPTGNTCRDQEIAPTKDAILPDAKYKRDKRIVDFELSYCCAYDADELDKGVVEEFKKAFLQTRDSQYDYTTEEVLFQAGALIKENGEYAFTNAGHLFFVSNPRKRFAGAFVRLLRYDVSAEDLRNYGATTLDKDFDGALPNIIRNLRTFFNDSAIFRTLSKRNHNGGFIDEPEYPFIAIDEAFVNAVVHRDYGVSNPIRCTAYRDSFAVRNPGSIPQQVPDSFSLHETSLDSVPRNPKIVEWMRIMKDEQGTPFVRALSEGTRRMLEEMEQLGLPAPHYLTNSDTTVTLWNRIDERLEKYASSALGAVED